MHEIGSIVEGKVTGITEFGAFVELDDGTVGMVHISEVSQTYVNDISEHLKENQVVKVKILGVNDNKKVSLSIKKALPQQSYNNNKNFNRDGGNKNFNRDGGNKNFNRDGGNKNFNRDGGNKNFNRDGGNKNFNRDGSNNNFNRDGGNKNFNRDGGNKNFNRDNNGDKSQNNQRSSGNNNRSNNDRNSYQNNNNYKRNAATTPKGPVEFEDMLSKFMSSSEDKMSDIKKPSSNRRGGHGSKRARDYD